MERDDHALGSWLVLRVRDLVHRPPVTCAPETSAADLAALATREAVGSVIVVDAQGAPIGIVTDRDLRRAVVAARRDATTTAASAIMSAPLITTRPGAFAFEALLEMTRREIHHLPVLDDGGRLVGVVSSHDLLMRQRAHPVLLAREIARAPSLPDLVRHAEHVVQLVQHLVREGASAYDVGQLVAELNDRIVVRVLALSEEALGEAGEPLPPVPFAWLAFGSEARREQTLRTDQDNGLVYADPPRELAPATAAYYGKLAERTIEGLVAVGFPPCPGGAMASNPAWCQPLAVWAGYFRQWIQDSAPDEVLNACIYFDIRPVFGATELAVRLTDLVHTEAPARRVFLGVLARDVAERRPPLSLLGHVTVRRSGPRRGTVDLKGAGSLQLVGAARLAALELSLTATNTIDRFRAAGARGLYSPEDTTEIVEAYQLLMRLRLVHQLHQLALGRPPDNDVDPEQLSHADGLLLREALKTVGRVQAGIRARFATYLLA
jgi:CBS domain-containing protein